MKTNYFEKTAALLTAVVLFFFLVAYGSNLNTAVYAADKPQTITEDVANVDGGWEVNEQSFSLKKHPDAKKAFKKATENLLGYSYQPVALLGKQTVAGTNYCILCRGTTVIPSASPAYELVYVYEDLEENAQITDVTELVGEQVTGGFTANSGKISLKKNKGVNILFKKAMRNVKDAKYEPIAYLGSQVVAGTNYLAIFRQTPIAPDAEPQLVLVTVYKGLTGKIKMDKIKAIQLGDANINVVDN